MTNFHEISLHTKTHTYIYIHTYQYMISPEEAVHTWTAWPICSNTLLYGPPAPKNPGKQPHLESEYEPTISSSTSLFFIILLLSWTSSSNCSLSLSWLASKLWNRSTRAWCRAISDFSPAMEVPWASPEKACAMRIVVVVVVVVVYYISLLLQAGWW